MLNMATRRFRLHRAMILLVAVQMLDWTRSEDPPTKCRFGGAEYDVGQTWHPRLQTQGTVFCVTCQCYQGGRMNCSSRECPITCSSSEDSSECCRICTESRTSNYRPASPDVVACIHNGRIYKDGQNFPSNSTGMKVNGPNQCVQCKCQEGLVLCEVQTCQEPSCHEPMHSPDNCCPICPEVAGNRELSSPVTFKDPTAPRDRRDKDCISAGKYYLDGSSWHPVIGPFGPMDCVMCQCNSGNIVCNRFKCPSRAELPCVKPAKQFGQCCPICPITVMSAVQQGIPEVGALQCIPKAAELVVYRAQGAGNLSEFLQYAFQHPDAKASETELHSWVMRSGAVHSFQLQTITASNFEDLRHKFHFVPLGTTSGKHAGKFERREKKLRRRCKTKCSSKVQRLEEVLSLGKVALRKTCLSSEMLLPSL